MNPLRLIDSTAFTNGSNGGKPVRPTAKKTFNMLIALNRPMVTDC
jgi:hypothetical protein